MDTIRQVHSQYLNGLKKPSDVISQAVKQATCEKAEGVFTQITADHAMGLAKRSDQRYEAGKPLGILDGISVIWKDLFDQIGWQTTAASLTQRGVAPARENAKVVEQLEAHGMCSIGRTNLSEFAFSGLGINPHFGTPSSVLMETEKTLPGGSSSGSAVGVGQGIALVGMGTDTSGSIRIPAALNGLYGFRPSTDRYSRKGVFPLSVTLDSVGTITNSFDDLVAVDDVLADREEIPSCQSGSTILDISDNLKVDWDAEIYDTYISELKRYEAKGFTIKCAKLSSVKQTYDLFSEFGTLVAIEAKRLHADLLKSERAALLDPVIFNRLMVTNALTDDQYGRYLNSRKNVVQQAAEEVKGILVAHPTVPGLRHAATPYLEDPSVALSLNADMLKATMIGSFLDFPGISVPLKNEEGRVISAILVSAGSGGDPFLLENVQRLIS